MFKELERIGKNKTKAQNESNLIFRGEVCPPPYVFDARDTKSCLLSLWKS
jgi:hypothetical protein